MPEPITTTSSLIYLGGSAVNALSNAHSANQNRIASEKQNLLNREHTDKLSAKNREHAEKMQVAQMKLSILQQEKTQQFQREMAERHHERAMEMAELNHELAMEIEEYRASVSMAINQKNLDFQKWRFEQEKQLQYEILRLQQEFQRESMQTQHQNALEQIRERIRSDRSPIINLAADLLENSLSHGVMPLKVLIAPPVLDYDSNNSGPKNAGWESYLAEEIRQFLHQGYLNSEQYPVQLLDKAWSTNRQGGGSALESLYAQLKAIPVIVLESETIGADKLNFRLGFWPGWNVPRTESTILSGHPYYELLCESAKQGALTWQETRKKLESLGKSEEFIQKMGGINDENLRIYQKELAEKEELEQQGINTSKFPLGKSFRIVEQDYQNFYQFLAVWHCLMIGSFADLLFFQRSWKNTPLLPSLFPYLLNKYKDNPLIPAEFWQENIANFVKSYSQMYDNLAVDSSCAIHEIRIKFALSLTGLPDEYKHLALEQGNKALDEWLRANNVSEHKLFDVNNDEDCQILKRIIYQEDEGFIQGLHQLLDNIKGVEGINGKAKISSLLVGWKFLNRWGNIPSLPQEEEVEKVEIFTNFTETLGDGVSIEMVAIPGGEFMMGSNENNEEKPIHQVKLSAFYMSKYPITQAQYKAIMGESPSHFKGKDQPVECVSWDNAVGFCRRLSEKTGKAYQLPSEAQWEYAARAGSTTKYCFGDNDNQLGEYAWYDQNSGEKTQVVGTKKPNQWGLYDMHGNVWEWCADTWHKNYNGAPNDGSAWVDSSNNTYVLRGGSWYNYSSNCRSAYRNSYTREYLTYLYGFRILLPLTRTL